jgi:hypothetical protein
LTEDLQGSLIRKEEGYTDEQKNHFKL